MARAQRWSDEWVAGLEHPPSGKPEAVYRDPSLARHRLTVTRLKKKFEVQAERRDNDKRRTFVVLVADAVIEQARKERGEIKSVVEVARKRAHEVLARIRAGDDPHGRPARVTNKNITLGQAWADYKTRPDLRPRTLRMYEGAWKRCLAKWQDEPLRALVMNPRMVRDEHRDIKNLKGPSEADHAMRLLRSIYRHAAKLDVSLPGDRNPCSAVDWSGDRTREGAAIPAAQMPAWKKQLEALREASPIRAAFHMLNLRLGTRPGELARARWSDIDLKRRVLTLPETKTSLVEVPLTDECIAEIKALEPARELNRGGRDFLFPATSKSGHLMQLTEPKDGLSHSGNSGRHSHHTIGTRLGIKEIVLDVLEGRSLIKSGAGAGRGYIDVIELGPEVRVAQQIINDEIDRKFLRGG